MMAHSNKYYDFKYARSGLNGLRIVGPPPTSQKQVQTFLTTIFASVEEKICNQPSSGFLRCSYRKLHGNV